MIVMYKDALSRSRVLRRELFEGYLDKVGRLYVEDYRADDENENIWSARFRCASIHQVFMLYGFLWDKWLKTGRAFDEFVLVKRGRYYYAEVYYVNPEDSRLRVAIVINNKKLEGY
jgi:hypothetical protein